MPPGLIVTIYGKPLQLNQLIKYHFPGNSTLVNTTKIFLFSLLIFLLTAPSFGQTEKPIVEIFFIHKLNGQIPLAIDPQNYAPANLLRLSRLKKWKKKGQERYIIDFGDNYLPGALAKYSSGLVIGEIFKDIGVSWSILGRNELQFNMESMSNLVRKSKIRLIGANLSFNKKKPLPFIDKKMVYVGKGKNKAAIIFIYGFPHFTDALPVKWPILKRSPLKSEKVLGYLSKVLEKLKNFNGPIIVAGAGIRKFSERIIKNFPRISAIILPAGSMLYRQKETFNTFAKTYSNNKVIYNVIPWNEGLLRIRIYPSGRIWGDHVNPRDLLAQKADREIVAKIKTWSNLYLEQKNKVYANLSRDVKPDELYPLFGRIIQDYFGVEWVGIPRDCFFPYGLIDDIDQFSLDNIVARGEIMYKIRVKGRKLESFLSRFSDKFYYWRGPGDPETASDDIDSDISYSLVIPSSIYNQAFLLDLVPEASFKIKTWKNSEETIQAYFADKKWPTDPPVAPVDVLIGPNPMWRYNWKFLNDFFWENVNVDNTGTQVSQTDFATSTLKSLAVATTLRFFFYNIYHKFTWEAHVEYSRNYDKVGDNQVKFTFNYDNLSLFLEPYFRTSIDTLVDYERVKEFYEVRPWILTNALGFSIPIWLTKHRIGVRVERDLTNSIKPRYGFEYFIDFSKVFLKMFTYVLSSENYLSYQDEKDFQKFGIEQNVGNKIKISLIEGLGITLSHKYKIYKTKEGQETQTLKNDSFKAMLTFEKFFQ